MASGDLVGFHGTFGTPPAPGDNTFTGTGWFRFPAEGGRLYFISTTPLRCDNASGLANDLEYKWVVTDSLGNGPTDLGAGRLTIDNYGMISPGVLFALSEDPFDTATVTFALQSREVPSGTNLTFVNSGGWNLYAMDVGALGAAMNSGGTGNPSGTFQRTTTWRATDSQSYDGSSNPFADDELAWRGNWGDGKGNTRSIVIFDGADIRTEMTGATIQSAVLGMWCDSTQETNGSLGFEGSTATTPPGTLGAGSIEYGFDDDFPTGQFHEVDILGDFLDDIIGGDNAMHVCSPILNAQTKFAGVDNLDRRPYIRVTYTK
jgi:hypothetical protein